MSRKILAILILSLMLLTFSLPAAALAHCGGGYGRDYDGDYDRGYGYECGGLMWDEDGNFRDREGFAAELDRLLAAGLISSEDKDYYLDMYDYCADNGGTYDRRGGCGGGRGRSYAARL